MIAAKDVMNWKVKVSCTFENTSDSEVLGGFGSMDEMCFNFGFYTFELAENDSEIAALVPAVTVPVAALEAAVAAPAVGNAK